MNLWNEESVGPLSYIPKKVFTKTWKYCILLHVDLDIIADMKISPPPKIMQEQLGARPRSDQHGPRPDQHDPRPDQHGPRPEQHGPRPDQHGPRPDQRDPRPDQHGPGTDQHGPSPEQHAPGPDKYGPRPDQHGPRPDQHGPRPDQHGPRPDQHGPGTDQHGPGTDQHGPRPDQHGPRPDQHDNFGPHDRMLSGFGPGRLPGPDFRQQALLSGNQDFRPRMGNQNFGPRGSGNFGPHGPDFRIRTPVGMRVPGPRGPPQEHFRHPMLDGPRAPPHGHPPEGFMGQDNSHFMGPPGGADGRFMPRGMQFRPRMPDSNYQLFPPTDNQDYGKLFPTLNAIFWAHQKEYSDLIY